MASTLADKVGHDGWIVVLLGGIVTSFLIWVIFCTLKRYGNRCILEINSFVFSKYIGNFLNLLIIAYLTYGATLCLRLFNDIIKMSALKLTPSLVLTSFISLPMIYMSWYGLKYICRCLSIQIVLIITVVLYYLLLSKYFRLTFLLPIGAAGLENIIKATLTPFTSLAGYELVSLVYPYIKDKKTALRSTLYANSFTVIMYLITIVMMTGFFGEAMLPHLIYPVFSLARAYRAAIFESLDLFFISLWFPIMLSTATVYYFCGYNGLKKLLRIENNKSKSKLLISVYTIMIILLGRLPKDMVQVNHLFARLGYISMGYVIYIFICYLLSFIKKGREGNEGAA
jgi:spore germination protein (amino acid permease)